MIQTQTDSLKSFEMVSSFGADPFVGHLSTPITTSNFTQSYLRFLPAYKDELSPLLKGLQIGFSHGYLLFGPFVALGPLRNSEVSSFLGFVSTLSLLFILTACLLIYGMVTYPKKDSTTSVSSNFVSFTGKTWNQFTSGFLVGGFGGSSFAYLFFKFCSGFAG